MDRRFDTAASIEGASLPFAGMADEIQGDVIPIDKPQTLNFTLASTTASRQSASTLASRA